MASNRRKDLPFTEMSDEPLDVWLNKHGSPYRAGVDLPLYLVEAKIDGEDLLVVRTDVGDTYGINRYGTQYGPKDLPFLTDIIFEWPSGVVVRGEMFVPGKKVFNIKPTLKSDPKKIKFAAHDILVKLPNGRDLRLLPLNQRKDILGTLKSLERAFILQPLGTASTKEEIIHLYEQSLKIGPHVEGVVVKPIWKGYDNNVCLKLKDSKTMDYLLTAVKETGALIKEQMPWSFRMETSDGIFMGDVSSGLTCLERAEIWQQVKDDLAPARHLNGEVYYFFKQPIVAEIEYQEPTPGGKLRSPRILRIRTDKPPEQCISTTL